MADRMMHSAPWAGRAASGRRERTTCCTPCDAYDQGLASPPVAALTGGRLPARRQRLCCRVTVSDFMVGSHDAAFRHGLGKSECSQPVRCA